MDNTPFHEFLTELLDEGKIVFRSVKAPRDRPDSRHVATLADAFGSYCLGVAGPRIGFDAGIACAAAEVVRHSSWAVVNHEERMTDLEKRLKMPSAPLTPSQHLSADLSLRFLAQILRRARGLNPSDPLIACITDVLRRWPLSGVLADIEEGPLVPLQFSGHPGLMLLYAERLVAHDRPLWRPVSPGPTWDFYELVLEERRQPAAVASGKGVHGG